MAEHQSHRFLRNGGFALAVAAPILVFLGEGLFFICTKSQTYDEAVHLCAGYSYLATHDFRLNVEHPPLTKVLAALPVYLGYQVPFDPDPALWSAAQQRPIARDFLYGRSPSSPPADRILNLARIPNLLLGAVLVGLVGLWSCRLWGKGACLLGMWLAALDPNLIAHSSLVTTDLGLALFTFLAFYLGWEYARTPSLGLLIGLGASVGLALASKFSAIVLLVILPAVILCYVVCGESFPLPGARGDPRQRKLTFRVLEAVLVLGIIACMAFTLLWPVYLFQDVTTWWQGLKWQLDHQHRGHPAFLMWEYSRFGWPEYFPIALLIKTPLGSLILMGASLVFFRVGRPFGLRGALFVLLPGVLLFLAAVGLRINIGLRHILYVYPFLFLIAARVATIRHRRVWVVPSLIGVALAVTGFSSLRVSPHYLAYFNELIGGPRQGLHYLSDSNIDWGQDLKGVKAYMERENLPMIYLSYFGDAPPEYYGIRYQYVPAFGAVKPRTFDALPEVMDREILAISVFNLQGVAFEDKSIYRWLRSRTPVTTIGYSIYIYDLTGDAEAHLRLAKAYLSKGSRALAAAELRKAVALEPSNTDAHRLLKSLSQTGQSTTGQFNWRPSQRSKAGFPPGPDTLTCRIRSNHRDEAEAVSHTEPATGFFCRGRWDTAEQALRELLIAHVTPGRSLSADAFRRPHDPLVGDIQLGQTKLSPPPTNRRILCTLRERILSWRN